jgi:phosphoribosylglycinamide formyltransferase-1
LKTDPKRIAIFASGTGSNAEKMIQYFRQRPEADVVWVGSNKISAPVLAMAEGYGVWSEAFDKEALHRPEGVLKTLTDQDIDLIVLAGFMIMFPKIILDAFPDKVVNIHPALLPKFGGKGMYGMNVHRAVKEAGESQTGITIHLVNEHYDEGAIVFQETVAVEDQDSPEQIASKVQQLEHRFYPEVVAQLLSRQS